MHFLSSLPVLEDFREVLDSERHLPIAGDWAIILSDIKGSTQAIAQGRYKEVNMVGAASILSVQNRVGKANVLFVFGGDGATFLVPSVLREEALAALRDTQAMTKRLFGMELRIGSVSVAEVRALGHDTRAALYLLSPTQLQPVMSGGGPRFAEQLIKNRTALPESDRASDPDLSGLECRWQPLPSRRGEIVSLLVEALGDSLKMQATYRRVYLALEAIYGGTQRRSPVQAEALSLSKSPKPYASEARAKSFGHGLAGYIGEFVRAYVTTQVAGVVWKFGHTFGRRYRQEVADQSDFRKFDGVLRMTLDSTASERDQLEKMLEIEERAGNLAFGIESAPTAIITCLVGNRTNGDHFHLVDGGSGGYAKAAVVLKARIAARSSAVA